jgi:hypothetical protein
MPAAPRSATEDELVPELEAVVKSSTESKSPPEGTMATPSAEALVVGATIAAPLLALAVAGTWKYWVSRRAIVHADLNRTAYGSAEILIWAEREDATDVEVGAAATFRRGAGQAQPLKRRAAFGRLRAGAPPMRVPILFLPEEYGQPLIVEVAYRDRTGRRQENIEVTWGNW